MTKTAFNKILSASRGIALPIFLFSTVFFWPFHQTNAGISPDISIIFKSGAANEVIFEHGLADAKKLFVDSTDPELTKVYKATTSPEVLSKLVSDERVQYAHADNPVSVGLILPSDPYFTNDPTFDDKQWYLPKIRMPEAWDYGTGKGNVTVAIVDTGIHASHVELNDGRIIAGFNSMDSSLIAANSDSDDNGHGTAVSGIIGAVSDNNLGITGINWKIRIMPVKALKADGTGEISSVAAGIVWAVDHGANIINLSLGGPGFGADQALNDAIQYAYVRDALVVAAAGNDLADQGLNLDTNQIYPICADNGQNMVLGVAASDVNDRKASFSNFGINCIDITAPGRKILTTAFLPSDPSDNVLIYGSGTSLATPIVTGVAALIKSNNFDLTNGQIRDIILGTADNIDALNPNNCLGTSCNGFLGKGRINAFAALSPQPILSGSFIRDAETQKIYQINGGVKQYVSQFVFQQRGFDSSKVKIEANSQLDTVPMGDPIPPLPGTLLKSVSNPTVYYIDNNLKRPLTFLVFTSRGFSFADVRALQEEDVNVLKTGEWYWPPDTTMVLISGNPTVYIMDQGVRRPVTFFVFTQRKLSFGRVVRVTPDEFSHIPVPTDSYWLPPVEETLVKSDISPTVYLIKDRSRRPLSGEAFFARGFKFSDVRTLPQAEIDVILPGSPIFN